METAGRLIGSDPIGIDRRPCRSVSLIWHLQLISQAAGLVALVMLALTMQGCSQSSLQTAEPVYPGPAQYAAYGYSYDPYATYDPFFYGYYWSLPYYYHPYSGDDGDHDCDDGFCGPHGGGRPPHLPWRVGLSTERLAPRESTEVTQRSIVSAPSAEPANSNLSAGYHTANVPSGGFGGGGLHSGGFGGGGFSGSSHR
jgi:hypothetical protein